MLTLMILDLPSRSSVVVLWAAEMSCHLGSEIKTKYTKNIVTQSCILSIKLNTMLNIYVISVITVTIIYTMALNTTTSLLS